MNLRTPTRQQILELIAQNPDSATGIAKSMQMSLPHVLAQLTVLEASGIITKHSEKTTGPGKPKLVYSLVNSITEISLLKPGFGTTVTYDNISVEMSTYLQIISALPPPMHQLFSIYFWKYSAQESKILARGLLQHSQTSIELVTITTKEYLDDLRKLISHYKKELDKTEYEVVSWVHTIDEIVEGCNKKDKYYLTIKERLKVLHDDTKIFNQLKEVDI